MTDRTRHIGRAEGRWVVYAGLLFIAALVFAFNSPDLTLSSGASVDNEALVVDLIERNGSGVTGQAVLMASGSDTKIRISVVDDDGGYLPFLHKGTCSRFGESISVPLSLAAPRNSSETTVDLDLETLTAGDVVIDLHVAQGTIESLMDPATSVACGTIMANGVSSSDDVIQAPIAGIGPFNVPDRWSDQTLYMLFAGGALAALAGLRAGRTPRSVEPALIDVDVVAMHRLRGIFL